MTRTEPKRILRALAARDLAWRLGYRLAAWLSTSLFIWSLAILVAVILVDTPGAPSAASFHAAIMAAIGSLPAFLAFPFRAGSGLEAARRADMNAAIESWLDYGGGPARRALEAGAFEALSVAAISGFLRPPRSRGARVAVPSIFLAGLATFAAAQLLSVSSGYGLSLSYPVKLLPDAVAPSADSGGSELPGILAPAPDEAADRGEPGARRYAGSSGEEAEDSALDAPGANPEPGSVGEARDALGIERAERALAPRESPSAGKPDRRAVPGGPRGSGDDADSRGAADSSGEARSPGWEGRGTALDASPLIDYRARIERRLTEITGRETILGDSPSAEMLSAAIGEYYASFDARVAVSSPVSPVIAGFMEAWRRAFGSEATR
jgi:hypothetical protein